MEVFVLTRVGSAVGGFSWELGVEDIDVEGKMESCSEGIFSMVIVKHWRTEIQITGESSIQLNRR